jgi:DNA modification methylase
MDFEYKKSGPIFNMHSYWTKQPIDPIKFFIKKYTKENDTVLDPFCGSGMTGIASIMTNRNAILNDLSNLAIHISKGYCTDFNIKKDIKKLEKIKNNLLKDLDTLYTTVCHTCQKNAKINFSIVSQIWHNDKGKEEDRGGILLKNVGAEPFKKDNHFKKFRLIKICFSCSCKKEKQYKKPDEIDIMRWNNNKYTKYEYPIDAFFGQEPKRNEKLGVKKVYQLYSKRNLSSLALILNKIKKIKNTKHKNLFLFIFSSILFNSSLMSRYRSYENTSIKMGTLYIPPIIKDTNVINNFENKFKIITRGNKEIFDNENKTKVNFYTNSAHTIKNVKAGSVDYVYMDPPYSDIINYSELNIVYESWLNMKSNNQYEMIVNKAANKDIKKYSNIFEKTLEKIYTLLKKNGHITIVFHHPKINHWKYIQNVFIKSKFKPIITNVPTRLISNNKTASQLKTQKKSQCFLVFNFQKNPNYSGVQLIDKNDDDYAEIIKKLKKEAIKLGYKGEADKYDFIINKILFKYKIKDFNV